jgi:hypothetical protein
LISIQPSMLSADQLNLELSRLRAAAEARDLSPALACIQSLVPDYSPSPSVLALARQAIPQVSQ